MTDTDYAAVWRKHPVSVLLFLAVWTGFLGCWLLGLLPVGEYPAREPPESGKFTQNEWWLRMALAMAMPVVLIAASIFVWRRGLARRPTNR